MTKLDALQFHSLDALVEYLRPAVDTFFTGPEIVAFEGLVKRAKESEHREKLSDFITRNDIRGLDGKLFTPEKLIELLTSERLP